MDDKGVWQATAFINIQSFSESLENVLFAKTKNFNHYIDKTI